MSALQTANITVRYVNQPKAGKRMGSIKDDTGQFYGCFPNMLTKFREGMNCTVEYEARPRDDGGEWRTVKSIVGTPTGTGAAPSMPTANYRARSNPSESKQIAVLAMVKEWVGKIAVGDEDALVHALQVCSRAYDKTLGGVQAQRRDDMDDEIPH